MKRAWLHIVMAVLAAFCGMACTTEENPGGSSYPGKEDIAGQDGRKKNYFIDIAVRAASETPSSGDSFYQGDDTHDWEHLLGESCNYAFFFDANEKLYTVSELTLVKRDDHHPEEENIEARYWTQFVADDDGNLPRYCLVILNAQRIESFLSQYTGTNAGDFDIDDILELKWPAETDPTYVGFTDDRKNFTLTNSLYVDADGRRRAAAEILPEMIKGERVPENGETITILTIYVERMVSKFSFAIEKNPTLQPETSDKIYQPSRDPDVVLFNGFHEDGSPKYTAKRWRIELTGWGVNALESSSYLFKQFDPTGNYFTGWNDPDNYRTYWAKDLTYTGNYPWQYRSVGYESVDNIPYYSYGNPGDIEMTRLNNYSFNELGLDGAAREKIENETEEAEISRFFSRTIYAPESTFDADDIRLPYSDATNRISRHDNRDEMLAASHLILGAHLQIEMVRNSGNYEERDLFRERSGFFYETERDVFAVQMHAMNQLLNSQKSMDYVYYTWDKVLASGDMTYDREYVINKDNKLEYHITKRPIKNGDKLASKPAEISTSDYNNYNFGVYWIDDKGVYTLLDDAFFANKCKDQASFEQMFGSLALGELPGGDGQRLPWPVKGKIVICNEDHVAIDIYTQDFERAGQQTQRERLRAANDNDVKSLLYEWVGATDHFNEGRMYYACGINHDPTGSAADSATGSGGTGRFGTVRNNWYQFNLKSISGLGVPVDDPDQPIVPDRAGPNDQINVMVSFLDWHTESTVTPPAGLNNY